MKTVIQRVSSASCTVDGTLISKINKGLLLLVGFTHEDTMEDVLYSAKKIANMRIFEDDFKKMNQSILDVKGSILNISQFTIYAETKKGNRPSFTNAMKPVEAEKLYHALTKTLSEVYNITTLEGKFGEMMDIKLCNDGPVTIILEK